MKSNPLTYSVYHSSMLSNDLGSSSIESNLTFKQKHRLCKFVTNMIQKDGKSGLTMPQSSTPPKSHLSSRKRSKANPIFWKSQTQSKYSG